MDSPTRVRALASCWACGTVTVPAARMTVVADWDLDDVIVRFDCPTCGRPSEIRPAAERVRTILGDERVRFLASGPSADA